MPDLYDREAFLRRFGASMKSANEAEKERVERHREQACRAKQAALPAPPVQGVPPAPQTGAVDLALKRVSGSAKARAEAERKAAEIAAAAREAEKREADAAVALILETFQSTSATQGRAP